MNSFLFDIYNDNICNVCTNNNVPTTSYSCTAYYVKIPNLLDWGYGSYKKKLTDILIQWFDTPNVTVCNYRKYGDRLKYVLIMINNITKDRFLQIIENIKQYQNTNTSFTLHNNNTLYVSLNTNVTIRIYNIINNTVNTLQNLCCKYISKYSSKHLIDELPSLLKRNVNLYYEEIFRCKEETIYSHSSYLKGIISPRYLKYYKITIVIHFHHNMIPEIIYCYSNEITEIHYSLYKYYKNPSTKIKNNRLTLHDTS